TADRNRSHWSTSKTPSYTKSVSWQHHPLIEFYPCLILFNQYQARYSVNNGVEYFNTIILY
ncbi:hypothetical protein SNC77_02360, partial [Escherichia coli]|nr:hypothetical protein [Escherichia coli]